MNGRKSYPNIALARRILVVGLAEAVGRKFEQFQCSFEVRI